MKYRVLYGDGEEYRVVDAEDYQNNGVPETLFHGSLADCDAWIRLTEAEYM
jgi:hypothetical protein